MGSQPGYEDANLILRLYELRREETMRAARKWYARKFQAATLEELNALCPPGSQENDYFRMVVTYWEMAASFVTSGVLNTELFFQSSTELLLVWERVSTVAPLLRESRKNAALYRNLEVVAAMLGQYMNRNSPGAYQAFQEYVRAMVR